MLYFVPLLTDLKMSDRDLDGGSEARSRGNGTVDGGTTKNGSFSNVFQAIVAWTFLFAVVAAFTLLVLMKVKAI